MVSKIKKRNEKIVDFDITKVESAIFRAAKAVGGTDRDMSAQLANKVKLELDQTLGEDIPDVEQIQDTVEKVLIEDRHVKTAKAYILYRAKRAEERKESEQTIEDMKKSAENLNFTDNAIRVLERRYLLKDGEGSLIENPKQLVWRISQNIAKADHFYGDDPTETAETFYDMIKELEFLPNSPTLMNAGTDLQQLSACFVLPVEDSMEGIFDAIKNTAMVHKSGGGTGFSFTRLRPTGNIVRSTSGVASGPISFMKVFDSATDVIKQGGKRRGANMGILRVDHPDVIDFINCKNDMTSLTNFNISVAVTDKFMEAVLNDGEYDLVNPKTSKVDGVYKARNVFNMMVQNAWKNGDPGIIFIDEVNRKHPAKNLGELESTNPCVVGSTLVSTEKGLVRMEDLVENYPEGGIEIATDNRVPIEISNKNGQKTLLAIGKKGVSFRKITKAFRTGEKKVAKVITKAGYELTATLDHKIMTVDKEWIPISDLKCGDKVFIQEGEGKFNKNNSLPFKPINEYKGKNGRKYSLNFPNKWSKELGQVLGLLIGDGWLRDGDKNCRVGFTFGRKETELLEKTKLVLDKFYGKDIKAIQRENGVWHLSYHSKYFVEFFRGLGVKSVKSGDKVVPESIFTAPKEAVTGFLQGLFTADGTIGKFYKEIRLTSSSNRLLKDTQVLLLNLGIRSKIYSRKYSKSKPFTYVNKKGEKKVYPCKDYYFELIIDGAGRWQFFKEIGFLNHKQTKLENGLKHCKRIIFEDEIVSIEEKGTETVYDLTEPTTLSFITNGLLSLDCGEQPLLPYESCNLGSINLHKFVKKDREDLNWARLEKCVKNGIHFLDNVIDMNKLPLKQIQEMSCKTRKVGLGIMGFADLLYELGIPYDSEEGLAMAEKIMKFVKDKAYEKSVELAEKRGVYPAWEGSEHHKEGKRMRNATCITIAPTGTISMIGEASSGCEPTFAISYIKNVMDNTELIYTNKVFEKIAKERMFYSPELMKKIAQAGTIQGFDEIPEDVKKFFVCAQDITPEWHIRMQAAFQKHTDNGISKTVNFPNNATIDDVEQVYILAYQLNCKGVTIYRDGCRENQVLNIGSVNKKKKEMEKAYEDKKEKEKLSKAELLDEGKCPECSSSLAREEGCAKCYACGFSVCNV
tara:strand:- start:934 stop:4350 length:3417 start_codon:yes stop_codon:yes gene_type:complete